MFPSRPTLFGVLLMVTIIIATGEKDINKCPDLKECPYNADSCTGDDDCNTDSICCESPCGKVCAKQLHTGCETLQRAASRRAKSLGVDIKTLRTPRCKSSGSFEPIQCDNEIVSSCWCVDEQGFELAGTRAPAVALVNCTEPKACAAHTCRMFCPHGFNLAPDGCPLCKCRDPCDDIQCPNSLNCQIEEIGCSDPPCPPIPTCKRGRSLDNICPVGDPLRISDTIRPFLCGDEPSKPTCPPMYQCLVQQGNDYGVCCPASLKIQKAGDCPTDIEEDYECGSLCTHDLECPSVQKCCTTSQCQSSCVHPKNVTECLHRKVLSELLSVNERMGKGYIPQCSTDGQFEPKQCSRNGLVCWCVDKMGTKVKGSMGAAESVHCSNDVRSLSSGRSIIHKNECEQLECAAVCEYGFKVDENGCSTCKCDDPCKGYACPEDEECIVVRESNCNDFLCPSLPVCRPKTIYANPCEQGTPLTDDLSGTPIACALGASEEGTFCPTNYGCTAVAGSTQAVCCPVEEKHENVADNQIIEQASEKIQTMCQYLHGFTDNMEGTREEMTIALPQPSCDSEGNYIATQCSKNDCWCVDQFGTEIPKTRGKQNATKNCAELRNSLECLDLTCRMGCDYGFILEEDTGCPACQCRDPCSSIKCEDNYQCQMVEVSCTDHYCPPVPACLPKKVGQCPYLVPGVTTSCEYECNSDLLCNGTQRCCSNGCGTQCVEPLLLTGCQHQRAVAQHQAHESGVPAGRAYIPQCKADGTYESLQCNHGKQECWCVDYRGFEMSQTRSPSNEHLDCESKALLRNCPLRRCSKDCDHGFELDKNGCRTCNCIEPCASITCRGEGESCRLVHVECVDWPCPALPMCLPKKENPCQNGEPLKVGNGDEVVSCGPEFENCPSSHKCQLSPLGEYAVCCPKPRTVCFESVDQGSCATNYESNNTRFFFNAKTNRCESFTYSGCQGNHNNFHTEEACNLVCPVLSQCERLREKNLKASERYQKPTFNPRCESATGNWEPIQCLEHVGVCWCVNPQGEALKGTVVRGQNPDCNFREARGRSMGKVKKSDADLILEQLMLQLTSADYVETGDLVAQENSVLGWQLPYQSRCEALKAQCDGTGRFLPAQCEDDQCWCVDEAGNQLPHTNTFQKGEKLCLMMPIEYVDVTIGFRGEFDELSALPILDNIRKIVANLRGVVRNDELVAQPSVDALYVKFLLVGSNKVDVAYLLEQMVKQQLFPDLTADITRSQFIHQLSSEPATAERVIALEHREIVSQSPVSVIAPYHTALIVLTTASAFIICILTLLVILYKRKISSLNHSASKLSEGNKRFMTTNLPIYIELPNEKLTPPSIRPDRTQESSITKN